MGQDLEITTAKKGEGHLELLKVTHEKTVKEQEMGRRKKKSMSAGST